MGINLYKMTKELAREYHREFQNDPDTFMDMDRFSPYVYSEQSSDAKYERQIRLGCEYLAILMNDTIIGQIIFKEIDRTCRCRTLSIHLNVKNQGFGMQAEKLAQAYAFDNMGMDTVYRDILLLPMLQRHMEKGSSMNRNWLAVGSLVYYSTITL